MTENNPTTPTNSPAELLPSIRRLSLAEQTAERLRKEITIGYLKPGSKLTERDVAERLGVSTVTVREALICLEKEGLIVSNGGRRRVVKLSYKDYLQLTQVRLRLEKLAIELAIDNMSEENGTELLEVLANWTESCGAGDVDAYERTHMALHRTIWRQAENPHLFEALIRITVPALTLVMSQKVNSWDTLDSDGLIKDHTALVKCIVCGDRKGAAEALTRNVSESIVSHLEVPANSQLSARGIGKSRGSQ